MRLPLGLAGLLLLAGLLGASPPASPEAGMVCGLAVPRAVQNDGESRGDAADAPAHAVRIAEDNYTWGFLDVEAQTGMSDLDDWYVASVPGGARVVNVSVVARVDYVVPPPLPALYPLPFHVQAWRGGELVVNALNGQGNVSVPSDAPATWLLHVFVAPVAGAPPLCLETHAPVGGLGMLPQEAQDYGVYFGCNPLCFYAAG
ncbi:MAG: hypothetical protein LC624_04690 [Halobacteriales archaeon]|nr:hypothetical protein [Halobacteriales archaeon]